MESQSIKAAKFKDRLYPDVPFLQFIPQCGLQGKDALLLQTHNQEWIEANNLDQQQFYQRYQKKHRPLVIRGCTDNWKKQFWTFKNVQQTIGELRAKIGSDQDSIDLKVTLKEFIDYVHYNQDDNPLYLFSSIMDNQLQYQPLLDSFSVPKYFKEDLMRLIGKKRPPFRWLLVGPKRSGTPIHKDPHSTCAWNTSLVGRKRWVMFPPNISQKIVKGEQFWQQNQQRSAIDYFLFILPKIKDKYQQNLPLTEFMQQQGETVFVPEDYWHAVLNVDHTLAITQNFMNEANFQSVWRRLREENISLAYKLLSQFKSQYPQYYEFASKINLADKKQFKEMEICGSSQSQKSIEERLNDLKSFETGKQKQQARLKHSSQEKLKSSSRKRRLSDSDF